MFFSWGLAGLHDIKLISSPSLLPDIRHPEELSLLRKPRDPKKKKKKLEEVEEDDPEMEGPLLTPGSGELFSWKGKFRPAQDSRSKNQSNFGAVGFFLQLVEGGTVVSTVIF